MPTEVGELLTRDGAGTTGITVLRRDWAVVTTTERALSQSDNSVELSRVTTSALTCCALVSSEVSHRIATMVNRLSVHT